MYNTSTIMSNNGFQFTTSESMFTGGIYLFWYLRGSIKYVARYSILRRCSLELPTERHVGHARSLPPPPVRCHLGPRRCHICPSRCQRSHDSGFSFATRTDVNCLQVPSRGNLGNFRKIFIHFQAKSTGHKRPQIFSNGY